MRRGGALTGKLQTGEIIMAGRQKSHPREEKSYNYKANLCARLLLFGGRGRWGEIHFPSQGVIQEGHEVSR